MFQGARAFNRDLDWDTSAATDMNQMFSSASTFNGNVSEFKTERVENMYYMFQSAIKFNADLSKWQTGAVTNMLSMFSEARTFNADLSKWQTGAVTNMGSMFDNACKIFFPSFFSFGVFFPHIFPHVSSRFFFVFPLPPPFNPTVVFNADVSSWQTSAVTNMYRMFYLARIFNADVSKFDTSKVTTMTEMFAGTAEFPSKFEGDVSKRNTDRATTMGNSKHFCLNLRVFSL